MGGIVFSLFSGFMSSRSISPPEPCTGRTGGTTPRSRRPPWTEPSGRPWSRRTSSGPQVRSSFVPFDVTGAASSLRSLLPPHVLGSVAPPVLVSAGLAVDYFNDRLYWADAKLSVIGSVRLDGSDPVVAVSGIKNSCVGKMKGKPRLDFPALRFSCASTCLYVPPLPVSRPPPSVQHRHL